MAFFRRQGGWYNQNIVYAVDNDLKTSLGKLSSILIAIFECIKFLLWMESIIILWGKGFKALPYNPRSLSIKPLLLMYLMYTHLART